MKQACAERRQQRLERCEVLANSDIDMHAQLTIETETDLGVARACILQECQDLVQFIRHQI